MWPGLCVEISIDFSGGNQPPGFSLLKNCNSDRQPWNKLRGNMCSHCLQEEIWFHLRVMIAVRIVSGTHHIPRRYSGTVATQYFRKPLGDSKLSGNSVTPARCTRDPLGDELEHASWRRSFWGDFPHVQIFCPGHFRMEVQGGELLTWWASFRGVPCQSGEYAKRGTGSLILSQKSWPRLGLAMCPGLVPAHYQRAFILGRNSLGLSPSQLLLLRAVQVLVPQFCFNATPRHRISGYA